MTISRRLLKNINITYLLFIIQLISTCSTAFYSHVSLFQLFFFPELLTSPKGNYFSLTMFKQFSNYKMVQQLFFCNTVSCFSVHIVFQLQNFSKSIFQLRTGSQTRFFFSKFLTFILFNYKRFFNYRMVVTDYFLCNSVSSLSVKISLITFFFLITVTFFNYKMAKWLRAIEAIFLQQCLKFFSYKCSFNRRRPYVF